MKINLHKKSSSVLFGALCVGIPTWILLIWLTRGTGITAVGFFVYLGIVCIAGGALWGLGMWHFLAKPRSGTKVARDTRRENGEGAS